MCMCVACILFHINNYFPLTSITQGDWHDVKLPNFPAAVSLSLLPAYPPARDPSNILWSSQEHSGLFPLYFQLFPTPPSSLLQRYLNALKTLSVSP